MRSLRQIARLALLVCGTLLTGCHTPAQRHASTSSVPHDPAQLLSGTWTTRKPGDPPKLFIPLGSYQQGQARGFWPEGGRYEVSRANPAARTIHISAFSTSMEAAASYRSFEADAQFSRDGRKMVLVVHKPNGIVQNETFQRIR